MAAQTATIEAERYLPFLLEIRKRLFFIVSFFIIASIFGFFFYERIIRLALGIFNLEGINIVFTSPFQFINLAIMAGITVGLLAVFPLVVAQVVSFLKPALRPKEYRIIVQMIPLVLLLFLAGFGFGILMMKYVVSLFYIKSLELEIGNFLDISLLLSQILLTAVLMGIAFQYPLILTSLMRLKIVKYKDVVKQRLLAYSASLIFAALLPPTDLLSLALLTIPLIFLFEITLVLNKAFLGTHKL